MKTPLQRTPQQEKFIETTTATGSVALRARPGTGKTFSLQQWADASKNSGVSTSYSKSTVDELAKKINQRFPAKSFHSTGLRALNGSGKTIKLEKNKIYEIVKSLSQDHNIPFDIQGDIRSLAAMAKTYGIQPKSSGPAGITPNDISTWESIADLYEIEFTDEILHWAKTTVDLSNELFLKDGIIDFDDMLYCSLIFPHRFARVGIILADEVQDFNLLQHTMLRRCLLPSGRVIAAGDDRQAIYGFRGALHDSYSELVKAFAMTELPLTVSHRCSKEVVKVAQQYVPDFEAAPNAPQGSVLYPSKMSLAEVPKTVLCRNNAPLMRLALKLLVRGRTVEIAGRDIGLNLIKVTERITKKNLKSEEFIERLERWKERELFKYPNRSFAIIERATALKTIATAHKTVDSMKKHLEKLYPHTGDKSYRPSDVHLSTIHKAKGKEWPDVLFLDSHLIGKYATLEWEKIQDENLAYVGITRTQNELTFISSRQIDGLDE
jgi:superfamily I DNA/RNA helicase